jgi:spermidine synthase
MVASGFAGLGYQVVWTQQSSLWLGHEAAGVLAVVAAFFAGLGVGALALARPIGKSTRPELWYAACEAAIGSWSLVLAFLLAPASSALLELIGAEPVPFVQWLLCFGGTFLLLLPATAAMGATLPAVALAMDRRPEVRGSIASLYAANTFGAVLGVLASAFLLVPHLGLAATAAICASLNLLCALAAPRLFRAADATAPRAAAAPSPPGAQSSRRLLATLAGTGLLGIGYEVLVVRVVSQIAENTVYTFAILLAVYLVGTTVGAAGYARVSFDEAERRDSHRGGAESVCDALTLWLAAACLFGLLCLARGRLVKQWVLGTLGHSMYAALAAECAIAVAAFLPATILMGALFSHLASQARAMPGGYGRALGVNTLAAAAAPVLFGVGLVPLLGPKLALLLVAVGYLVLCSHRAWMSASRWAALAGAAVLAFALPPLTLVDVPAGGRLVRYDEGVLGTVSVVEDANGVASLHINNRQQEGSTGTLYADARQALLPLLLHPAPRHILFLGLGTGVTASAAADERALAVDAVELVPEVVDAAAYFADKLGTTQAHDRLRIVTADARRYVRVATQQYDVIIADNFHPARGGSAALYTVEHFAAVRERLANDGLFCQWLPLHQLDLDTLRSIVRSFLAVYPDGKALLATYSLETPVLGLITQADGGGIDPARVRGRLATAERPSSDPAAFGFLDDLSVLGTFIAGPRALTRFASEAPLNTDDHPIVAHRAPRATYVPEAEPGARLVALLEALSIEPAELLAAPYDAAWAHRLAAYWAARDRFVAAGRDVEVTADARSMLAQVQEPLLDSLRISADFRPAFDPLLAMALALARTDPDAARPLLVDLQRIQPAREEAALALRELER